MQGEYSIDIAAPREGVFDFLADDDNIMDIVPNLVDHGFIDVKDGVVGTTFWHEYEEKGRKMKMTGVVSEHRKPDLMAVDMDGSMFSLVVRYNLEELGPNSTLLTQFSHAKMKHVFKIFSLLFGKKMQAEGEKVQKENFARMKALIEEKYGQPEAATSATD